MKNSFDFINRQESDWPFSWRLCWRLLVTTITAEANDMYQLEVKYTNGAIISGPLSFGLTHYPLGHRNFHSWSRSTQYPEPGEEYDIYFDDEDLAYASVSFGDAHYLDSG